jgi:MATE family multidrug resistance protein
VNFSKYTQEFSYNLRLAYPIRDVGHTIVGIVDNIMVGKLTKLAAVSLGNSFFFYSHVIRYWFSTAITPWQQSLTGRMILKREEVFHHGLFLCTILGFTLFLIIFFFKPLISLMGQPDIVEMAKPYLDIVAFSLVPLIFFRRTNNLLMGNQILKFYVGYYHWECH